MCLLTVSMLQAGTLLDPTRGDNPEWEMLTDSCMVVTRSFALPRETTILGTWVLTAKEGQLMSLSPVPAVFLQTP